MYEARLLNWKRVTSSLLRSCFMDVCCHRVTTQHSCLPSTSAVYFSIRRATTRETCSELDPTSSTTTPIMSSTSWSRWTTTPFPWSCWTLSSTAHTAWWTLRTFRRPTTWPDLPRSAWACLYSSVSWPPKLMKLGLWERFKSPCHLVALLDVAFLRGASCHRWVTQALLTARMKKVQSRAPVLKKSLKRSIRKTKTHTTGWTRTAFWELTGSLEPKPALRRRRARAFLAALKKTATS